MYGSRWVRRATVVALVGACAIAVTIAGGAALSATNNGPPVMASSQAGQGGRQISLRDQLRTGLKAFTTDDFAFIDQIVLKVDQGHLPRSVVDSTFLWARKRVETYSTKYAKRPMVYFKPAMIQRAKPYGVLL